MSVRPYKKRSGEAVPGVWLIDFRPEGNAGPHRKIQYPEGGGTCTRAEALAFEQECRRLSVTHQNRRPVNPSIESILPEYLEWHTLHRSPKTHQDKLYALKGLMEVFGPLPVSRITQGDIMRFKSRRPDHPRAINKDLHYLSAIISWMVKNDYAQPLPFKIEQMPYSRPMPSPPSASDVEAMMQEIQDPAKLAIIIIMLEAGTRWAETAALRWENVDLGEGTIKIIGKGNKWRIVLLPERASEIISLGRKPEGWVFPNPKTGRPYGSFKTMFKGACLRAGVKRIKPHGLRHRAATDTLEATGDLALVQRLLGHEEIRTTTIYTHIVTGRLRDAAGKVAALRGRRKQP